METEADGAAKAPKEEAEAGEPAAEGAVAAPMETDSKKSAAEPEAPAAEVSHLHLVLLAVARAEYTCLMQQECCQVTMQKGA